MRPATKIAPQQDSDRLREINEEFILAVRAGDPKRFQPYLSEDFLNSNPDTSLVDRAAFLKQIARPVANLAAHDVRIRLLGDVAVIHGRTTYDKPDGQPGHGRYTDVYARRDGRWLCIAAHVTR